MNENPSTPTPDQAREALASAQSSEGRVRAQGRWDPTYMAAFGLGFGALTVVVGMVSSPIALIPVMGVWAVFVAAMVWWTARQRATDRAAARRMMPWWPLTGIAYGVALAAGLSFDWSMAAWWVAGVVVALPLLIGAIRASRA